MQEIRESATDVTGACFEGADLRGVDLRQVVGLTVDQIRGAIIDQTTLLPEHLKQLAS